MPATVSMSIGHSSSLDGSKFLMVQTICCDSKKDTSLLEKASEVCMGSPWVFDRIQPSIPQEDAEGSREQANNAVAEQATVTGTELIDGAGSAAISVQEKHPPAASLGATETASALSDTVDTEGVGLDSLGDTVDNERQEKSPPAGSHNATATSSALSAGGAEKQGDFQTTIADSQASSADDKAADKASFAEDAAGGKAAAQHFSDEDEQGRSDPDYESSQTSVHSTAAGQTCDVKPGDLTVSLVDHRPGPHGLQDKFYHHEVSSILAQCTHE